GGADGHGRRIWGHCHRPLARQAVGEDSLRADDSKKFLSKRRDFASGLRQPERVANKIGAAPISRSAAAAVLFLRPFPGLAARAARAARCRRAAEQRYDFAPFPLTEMHPIPQGPGAFESKGLST